MARKIPSVTLWLLRNSPEVVKKLERVPEKPLCVRVSSKENQTEAHSQDPVLLVNEGIEVYQVSKNYRGDNLLFFSAREGGDFNPAYLSVVDSISLHPAIGIPKLFEYPWFDNRTSSLLFDRFFRLSGNTPLSGYKPNTSRWCSHPLL